MSNLSSSQSDEFDTSNLTSSSVTLRCPICRAELRSTDEAWVLEEAAGRTELSDYLLTSTADDADFIRAKIRLGEAGEADSEDGDVSDNIDDEDERSYDEEDDRDGGRMGKNSLTPIVTPAPRVTFVVSLVFLTVLTLK